MVDEGEEVVAEVAAACDSLRGVFCLWELCSNSAQERARERRQGLRRARECVVSTAATGYGGRCASAVLVKLSQALLPE